MALLHHLLDHAASRHGSATAIDDGRLSLTYAELCDRSERYADWITELGVGPGDRVVVIGAHSVDAVAAIFGTSRVGASFVILNDSTPDQLLAHIISDCTPALILGGDVAGRTPSRPLVLPSSRLRQGTPRPTMSESDIVSLIYTSGSTAMPKAVVSTHQQVTFAAAAIQERLNYLESDTVFSALPLSFDYGLYQVFLCTLSGAKLVLGPMAGSGVRLLSDVEATGATVLPAVPSLSKILMLLLHRGGQCPTRLRMLTNTGAALPQHVADQLRNKVPGLEIITMFGLTECKRVSISAPNADLLFPGSCGRALSGTRVSILDEDGLDLPPGAIGELVVIGPHVMNGYWGAEELTAKKFRVLSSGERMLMTGDMCRIDKDGNLYFEGRRDDLYKQNGFRVSGTEIEAAVMTIAGVHDAAVVPPSDDRGATLWVCADESFEMSTVIDGLHQRIERHKMPDSIRKIDILPLTANGKVDRKVLSTSVPPS